MQLPWAAFLASALWAGIIARECPPTRGEYWQIWMAGAIMWLALLQGIRLAFWPLYLGWIALALYVAVYLPLFIAMGRSLHHRWRFPLPVAAAIAWVGCELIRAYFATGFAACMLAHSQTPWPWMLPIASQFGSYGVSYVVMFMGALIYQWATWAYARRYGLPWVRGNGSLLANISFSVFALAVVLGFATYLRSYERWIAEQEPIKPLGRIALIQENMPTQFDSDFQDAELGWQRYEQQTSIVAQTTRSSGVDLVVWPESTFSRGVPWFDWDSSGVPK